MSVPLIQVDAFTDIPYTGNPAAVCVLREARDAVWMQAVAAEMNLSETAFLVPQADPEGRAFHLRWFTPQVEVALCGHATLGSAHVLWSEGHLAPTETARFHTMSGLLTAERGQDGWIMMNFPAQLEAAVEPPAGLAEALGVSPLYVGRNQDDYLVEVESPEIIRALQPDMQKLAQIRTRGVMVTSRSYNEAYDFISRFFAPAVGIPEDPVTGSAHCCLGPYWSQKLGKKQLIGYQASPRGGVVRVRHDGERILLAGQAVTVLRGELV
ncbi:MAG: PhzF family phenazine biosynthesis protein [Ardenticatenaceae bacterium]